MKCEDYFGFLLLSEEVYFRVAVGGYFGIMVERLGIKLKLRGGKGWENFGEMKFYFWLSYVWSLFYMSFVKVFENFLCLVIFYLFNCNLSLIDF